MSKPTGIIVDDMYLPSCVRERYSNKIKRGDSKRLPRKLKKKLNKDELDLFKMRKFWFKFASMGIIYGKPTIISSPKKNKVKFIKI